MSVTMMLTPELTTILYGVAILCLLLVVYGLRRFVLMRMADRVIRDPLTGTYTPDFIEEIYQTELRRAERTGVPFSVALVAVRDAPRKPVQMPPQQDEVSLALSRWLKDHLRGCDYVGRLDANRFVVILPETWDDDARSVAQRINGTFRYVPAYSGGNESSLACDVAVATWRPEEPDVWTGASRRLEQQAALAAS